MIIRVHSRVRRYRAEQVSEGFTVYVPVVEYGCVAVMRHVLKMILFKL